MLIEQMVAEMGKRWAEIARRLRGRSDNAVKNWWNGGMNRRRRSNNHRRTELEVRESPNAHIHASPQIRGNALPTSYANTDTSRHPYHGNPMYQSARMPQHTNVPGIGAPFRHPGMVETPLPSPSAFSQMSADGAPSLVSDSSSISTRSPHNGASPMELPPLAGSRDERRHSSAPVLRLNVPGMLPCEPQYQIPSMQTARFNDSQKQHQMLQEPFQPQPQQQHVFRHPADFSQPQLQYHQTSSLPHVPSHYSLPSQAYTLQRGQSYPPQYTFAPPPPSLQLPSISTLSGPGGASRSKSPGIPIDPTLTQMHCTPTPAVQQPTPEGSPKDKMSLSAITD